MIFMFVVELFSRKYKMQFIKILLTAVCAIFLSSCNTDTRSPRVSKVFLDAEEIENINELRTKLDMSSRYILLIRIDNDACFTCMTEVIYWNELNNEIELDVVAVLEDSLFIEDIPDEMKFSFPFTLNQYVSLPFTRIGTIEKVLIDKGSNRILFIDFAYTSIKAHESFYNTVLSLISYP